MSQNDDLPKFGHGKVPLWIKLMWLLGITWIIIYIVNGLSHTPTTW